MAVPPDAYFKCIELNMFNVTWEKSPKWDISVYVQYGEDHIQLQPAGQL